MVVCEQHRDEVLDIAPVIVIGPLAGETDEQTLERKLAGAIAHGWQTESIADGFHAWKLYTDGDGTLSRAHRKDRYFRIVP